jgi:hypothetical protein
VTVKLSCCLISLEFGGSLEALIEDSNFLYTSPYSFSSTVGPVYLCPLYLILGSYTRFELPEGRTSGRLERVWRIRPEDLAGNGAVSISAVA